MLKAGKTDAGIVWKTEAIEAVRDEVAYAIGALKGSPRGEAAMRYLAFLATPQGQAAYTAFGFVGATPEEPRLKPIP